MFRKYKEFSWYWARLCQMSSEEIFYRIKWYINSYFTQLGYKRADKVNQFNKTNYSENKWLIPSNNLKGSNYKFKANRIISGNLDIFSINKIDIGNPPNWHLNPKCKTISPNPFGLFFDYKDKNLVGDIKYLWELNRHIHLVLLAQVYYLTEEDKYRDNLIKQIESWVEQCKYLFGPNWTSSLELSIRLVNWSIIWQLIGVDDDNYHEIGPDGFCSRWLESIYQHVHFIQNNYSRYSSANNHLIGEAAGVYIATTTWPNLKHFDQWRRKAKKILIHETLKQNTPSGVNREQAISYQQFVLDFLIISGLAGERTDDSFPEKYWNRIESMLEYLASIMDVNGNIPMFGDADDGYVVRLSTDDDFCPYRSLLATGAVLFDRSDFKHKAGKLDDKSRWLLGERAEDYNLINETGEEKFPIKQIFPEGGYCILGDSFESQDEVHLVIDGGPLGYLSIAAHGHADALSFTLSIGGQEILIDPGTYAYHTQKKWRNYFRGTAAHNTIRLDEKNQSVISGNFMWSHKADAKIIETHFSPDHDVFLGKHDGYMRLDDPVLHKRKIELNKEQNGIRVTDIIKCNGNHFIEQFWHFSEHCSIKIDDDALFVNCMGKEIKMDNLNSLSVNVFRGSEEPILGWISRGYDVKNPTYSVVFFGKIKGTTNLITEIDYSETIGR